MMIRVFEMILGLDVMDNMILSGLAIDWIGNLVKWLDEMECSVNVVRLDVCHV
jgi:hypothetical protein